MFRLNRDGDTIGLQAVHHDVGDLGGEPLLQLRAPGDGVDQPRELGDADHAPARHVGDMRRAAEREEVVFADREEGDIAEDHHFVVALVEADLEQRFGVDFASAEHFLERRGDAAGRFEQSLAVGVFAQREQQFAHGALRAGQVHLAAAGRGGVLAHDSPAASADATSP